MIISHAHRFIFLKTKKTAGTALEAALCRLCGSEDVITPFREDQEQHRQGRGPQNFRISHPLKPRRSWRQRLTGAPEKYYHPTVGYYEHMPAWRVRAYVGETTWRLYFKFAFERNPWDRQISWYHYKTKSLESRPSFQEFMANKTRAYVDNFEIYSEDGIPVVDFVGRFEELEQDLEQALSVVGVHSAPRIPHINATASRSDEYRPYFCDHTRAMVSDWYVREIDLLGYTF